MFERKYKLTNPDLKALPELSVFPSINSVVLRVDNKLIVFSPSYLLGKHGVGSQQVSSKFLDLRTASQLLAAVRKHISAGKLKGDRVEIKEINMGVNCGTDNLVEINKETAQMLVEEDVRGAKIKVLYTSRDKIPLTKLMNFILVKFDPKFGQGVELLFKEKHGNIFSFENFEAVYAILTMFPGRYAPPFSDAHFWSRHALLKEK